GYGPERSPSLPSLTIAASASPAAPPVSGCVLGQQRIVYGAWFGDRPQTRDALAAALPAGAASWCRVSRTPTLEIAACRLSAETGPIPAPDVCVGGVAPVVGVDRPASGPAEALHPETAAAAALHHQGPASPAASSMATVSPETCVVGHRLLRFAAGHGRSFGARMRSILSPVCGAVNAEPAVCWPALREAPFRLPALENGGAAVTGRGDKRSWREIKRSRGWLLDALGAVGVSPPLISTTVPKMHWLTMNFESDQLRARGGPFFRQQPGEDAAAYYEDLSCPSPLFICLAGLLCLMLAAAPSPACRPSPSSCWPCASPVGFAATAAGSHRQLLQCHPLAGDGLRPLRCPAGCRSRWLAACWLCPHRRCGRLPGRPRLRTAARREAFAWAYQTTDSQLEVLLVKEACSSLVKNLLPEEVASAILRQPIAQRNFLHSLCVEEHSLIAVLHIGLSVASDEAVSASPNSAALTGHSGRCLANLTALIDELLDHQQQQQHQHQPDFINRRHRQDPLHRPRLGPPLGRRASTAACATRRPASCSTSPSCCSSPAGFVGDCRATAATAAGCG
uniref:Protein kinase domain-containing protein n=1 Tax=Macrostomum lignano TaxID=282301 RepID=A0A1I8FN33_9PLAT